MATTRRGNATDKKGKKQSFVPTGHKAVGCYKGLIELRLLYLLPSTADSLIKSSFDIMQPHSITHCCTMCQACAVFHTPTYQEIDPER